MAPIYVEYMNNSVDFSISDSDAFASTYSSSVTISATGYICSAAASLSALISFILVWQLRTKVRERFMIPGSCCDDYCCVWWCPCCVIAQLATHVKSYKPGSCDFGPPDTLPPYRE
ncbi:hypothetical protein PINS_up009623 [Pythium insidiosum]|nr:hypothetical protein PINS_up009623 [Pythium insidiosum]